MIAGCGLTTRVLDVRSRAGLAGPAHPLRHDQRHRDPGPPTRSRRAAPHQPPPEDVLARPRRAQRPEQTVARPVAPATAGLAPHAAALAPPARHPTLDQPAPTTRPTAHRCADPGARILAGRTSEDHKHMRCRIWWLACGNAEEAGSGRVTTARWSERGWSAAVGEGEVEESGWFG